MLLLLVGVGISLVWLGRAIRRNKPRDRLARLALVCFVAGGLLFAFRGIPYRWYLNHCSASVVAG